MGPPGSIGWSHDLLSSRKEAATQPSSRSPSIRWSASTFARVSPVAVRFFYISRHHRTPHRCVSARRGQFSHFNIAARVVCERRRNNGGKSGIGSREIWEGLRQQIYLEDEAFVARVQRQVRIEGDRLAVPQVQRRPPPPTLAQIEKRSAGRNANPGGLIYPSLRLSRNR